MRDKRATAVVLRPDGFVYAATDGTTPLPGHPADLVPAAERSVAAR
jgi:hypothetical protein